MRVLIVNGYPSSSKRGGERFVQFRYHVTKVVRELQKTEFTRVEVVEMHHSSLDPFLFELHSDFANPSSITNFDQLDFVFVDGDANSRPWAPNMRKLVLLTKMCMMTGKCFFGSGVGASFLAFVCCTGGEQLQVINNDGKGSLLNKLQNIPRPSQNSRSTGFAAPDGEDKNVLLDIKTGDLFVFVERKNSWVPKGNTGLVLHSSDITCCYGARPNSARAGSKKTHPRQISGPLFLAKRGDIRCSIRLEVANQHPVVVATFPQIRELVLNCKSKWDLDEKISSTGGNKYVVLIDSSRGPMLLEFGNCLGTHFELASEYPETLALLRNFTLTKYDDIKIRAHIDRSYVSAISGSARLKQELICAQNKHVSIRQITQIGSDLVEGKQGVGIGRISPKRCRPVSACRYRPERKEATPRRVQSARSTFSPKQHLSRPNTAAPSTNKSDAALEDYRKNIERTAANQSTHESLHNQGRRTRMVRVPQENEVEKSYCAQRRFAKMRQIEKALGTTYCSVVNDAPYSSVYEQEVVSMKKSKLKWTSGPFRSAFGKASTQLAPVASIFINDPFEQKNVPYYMTQRRQLDASDTTSQIQRHEN